MDGRNPFLDQDAAVEDIEYGRIHHHVESLVGNIQIQYIWSLVSQIESTSIIFIVAEELQDGGLRILDISKFKFEAVCGAW